MKRIFAFVVFLLFLAGIALVNLASMKPASGASNERPAGSPSGNTVDAGGALPAKQIRRLTAEQVQPALALFLEYSSLPNDARNPDDILRRISAISSSTGHQPRPNSSRGRISSR